MEDSACVVSVENNIERIKSKSRRRRREEKKAVIIINKKIIIIIKIKK